MKRKIGLLFLVIVLLVVLMVNGSIFDFFKKKPITGMASSQDTTVSIMVVVPLPDLNLFSPTNTSYTSSLVLLDYTVQYAVTTWYNLDGGTNFTLVSPILLDILDGGHVLNLYAINGDGNVSSTSVSFSVADSGDGGVALESELGL